MNALFRGLLWFYPRLFSGPCPPKGTPNHLPIVEIPSVASPVDAMAILVSGDGGWAAIDRVVAQTIASHGIPVVGFDSLRYFWRRRTPDETARAVEQTLRHYRSKWSKRRTILIGYSRGANILPFAIRRLPPDLLQSVALVVLLAPGLSEEFEIRLRDWMRDLADLFHCRNASEKCIGLYHRLADSHEEPPVSVLLEIEKIADLSILCVYGKEEEDPLSPLLEARGIARVVCLEGGHHFDHDYAALGRMIVSECDQALRPT